MSAIKPDFSTAEVVQDNTVGSSRDLYQHYELEILNTSSVSKRNKLVDGANKREHTISRDSLDASNPEDAMLSMDKDIDFPEGGTQAYLSLFGSFIGMIANYGFLNSIGAIETYLSENTLKHESSLTVSWIFSILLFVNTTVLVFSGTFFDRNGAKKQMILGTILVMIGFMGTANSTKVWHFILSLSIVFGIGNGMIDSPLICSVSHYFNRRRGLMVSIAGSGAAVGGIIFPIMLRKLFEEVGFAWTIRIVAFFELGCYLIAIALVRERLPLQKSDDKTNWQKIAGYLNAVDFKGLLDYKFFFNVLGCSFAESASMSISTYQISYARAQGCSLNDSYMMLTVSNATSLLGRWLSGYASDKLGRYNVLTITLFISGVVIYVCLLPFKSSVVAMYVFSALWGFFTGSIFPLLSVCCGQISKTDEFGRRYGTMYFVTSFAVLISVPISGAIIGREDTLGFRNWVIYSGVTIIFAGLFYYISRAFCVGNRLVKF